MPAVKKTGWKALVALVGAATAGVLIATTPIHEGVRLAPYKDPVGIWTVCMGHTGQHVVPGMVYTRAECEEILAQDLATHAAGVNACIKVPLTDGQRAASVSLAFNIGVTAFCRSTIVRLFNGGDPAGACAQFSRWTKAGGRELPGLVKRRAAERKLCEEGI